MCDVTYLMLLRLIGIFVSACVLGGCQSLSRYEVELNQVSDAVLSGQLDDALGLHERRHVTANQLLYFLEAGELYWLKGDYDQALKLWRAADLLVQAWESLARLDTGLITQDVGSVLINDKVKSYQGYDFEKVMLTTRIALTHLMMGDVASARVAIKSTHEREAIIEGFRERQALLVSQEDAQKSYRIEDLNGYPVETSDAPELSGLRNSYQNAFSHYLAGFIYEQLNEPSLSAPGYRKAIELRSNHPVLRAGLMGLEERIKRPDDDGYTDLLVVYEEGLSPSKISIEINGLVVHNGGITYVPFSVPAYGARSELPQPSVIVAGDVIEFSPDIVDIDLMSRRSLKDEMPGIITRGVLRSGLKVSMQSAADELDDSGVVGDLVALAAIVTESADDRSWRLLPARIGLGRVLMHRGAHHIEFRSGSSSRSMDVVVDGKYMLLFMRRVGAQWYVKQVSFD